MKCFICERTEDEILLMKLPLDIKWGEIHIEIIGNAKPNEWVCLPCMGYQYDFRHTEITRLLA
jgi:hypothetical protein